LKLKEIWYRGTQSAKKKYSQEGIMAKMEWESYKAYRGGSEVGFIVRKICGNSKILCQLKQNGNKQGGD
jgi:hypothetical protein